jgi:hypothetical protein
MGIVRSRGASAPSALRRAVTVSDEGESDMATTGAGPQGTGVYRGDRSNDLVGTYDDERGSGWLFFAGTVLGFAGLLRIVDAIWAFGYHGALPDRLQDGVLGSDIKTYAWVWLIVGVILIVSSFFVLVRSQFARWIGMIAAVIGGVAAMFWMPYYPIWSLTYIGIALFVLYALARYGGREAA